MQVKSANTSFSIAAVNQVRYSYGGIYLYTYDFQRPPLHRHQRRGL